MAQSAAEAAEVAELAEAQPGRRVAIFLDRDGVLNRPAPEGAYIESLAQFELLPGVVDALAELVRGGAALFVATNQRGVARGFVPARELDAMHSSLSATLAAAGAPLTGIYVCPHHADSCNCRKPGIGMFTQAKADNPWIDLSASHLIGDSLSDMQAARAAGMSAWLVGLKRRHVGQRAAETGVSIAGSADSLAELVRDRAFRSAVGLA
jgi:histidinol-phosphate phosphatase family protein